MSKSKSDRLWYPRYPGDYARKTAHLSMAEHGAYALLMDHYYSNGRALPANWVQLHRICKAVAPDEQDAVQSVVEQFFVKNGAAWHNARADEEITKKAELSEKRRLAQAAREEKYRPKRACKKGAIAPTATTTSVSLSSDKETSAALSAPVLDMMFQNFWNAYPGRGRDGASGNGYKGSRERARITFNMILKNFGGEDDRQQWLEQIKNACAQYAAHLDRSGTPSRHAATWLNQRGWEDDYSSTEPQRTPRSGGKSVSDTVTDYISSLQPG